jgi:hypothetical protein
MAWVNRAMYDAILHQTFPLEENMASKQFKGKLISSGMNAKTVKGDGSEYVTAILYMAPADTVDGINLCPMAELAGCKAACLYTAGRGAFNNVQQSRIRKTIQFRDDRDGFMADLVMDLERFRVWCEKHDVKPVVRLNGTSDIRWENIPTDFVGTTVFQLFPEIQFYDYTKIANRRVDMIANYHLTMSYSEASERFAGLAKDNPHNLAVVFRSQDSIPAEFLGRPVINGDADDLRFLDPKGVVVALYAKGAAKRDTTGFVVG